ncbi:MAG TPA: GNAT family N-acetyltransferase [Longimicrobium sp.]|nr:GNAT family N-acetyltransferase [Longimicrobium sp.]
MTIEAEELTIRRAVSADAPVVAELALRTFMEAFAADNDPDDVAAYTARVYGVRQQAAEIADPRMITLLAEFGDTPAGYAQVRRGPPAEPVRDVPGVVEIARFYVDAPWHGRGVAHRLMDAVFDAARELGGRAIWLGVWERNARGIAFYTRRGFRDVGAHEFILGADHQTDRVMLKELEDTPASGRSE